MLFLLWNKISRFKRKFCVKRKFKRKLREKFEKIIKVAGEMAENNQIKKYYRKYYTLEDNSERNKYDLRITPLGY